MKKNILNKDYTKTNEWLSLDIKDRESLIVIAKKLSDPNEKGSSDFGVQGDFNFATYKAMGISNPVPSDIIEEASKKFMLSNLLQNKKPLELIINPI